MHFACVGCCLNGYRVDATMGMAGYLSPRALRLASFAAADRSFDVAAGYLHEFCGVVVDGETLRSHVEQVAGTMTAWQASSTHVAESFQAATGEVELQMDAGKVNTTIGWRDLKVASFAKRPLGQATPIEDWAKRQLPKASARTMFAALEPIEAFECRLRPYALWLGIDIASAIHALGDGAEWVWNTVTRQFAHAVQTLDIYHGSEYVAAASKGIYGEGGPEQKANFQHGQGKLVGKGWQGICEYIAEELAKQDTPKVREATAPLITYFSKHLGRLDYKKRLEQGQAMGSGMIEGNVKTIGLRMKARGARWRTENVDKMAGLCCLRNSTSWNAYWIDWTCAV
jgi:hypothetical protein